MNTAASIFVLISDDGLLARALTSSLSNRAALRVVSNVEQALALLDCLPAVAGRNVSTSLRHRLVEFTEAKECLKPAQPMRPARVC